MKTAIRNILIGAALLISTGQALAYPPDNAAVLYYKSFMLLEEPNDTVKKMLKDLKDDKIGLNEPIRRYVESNRKVINEVVTAAEIKNCDWGLNYSDGMAMLIPHLAKLRSVTYLLAADAKVLAEKGDYKTALERCITMYKMGGHAGDDTIVQGLVGIAIDGVADRRVVEILPQVSNDTETLQRLRGQLGDVSSRFPSMRVAVGMGGEVWEHSLNKEGLLEAVHSSDFSKSDQDKVEQVLRQHDNDEFYVRVGEYYQSIISREQIAYDLPYPQAKQKLDNIYGEVQKTAKEKPEAAIVGVLLPAINRVLTIDTREKTHLNAVIAGIDIYIIRAKAGKLPDEMPAGLPKDLFSGKDFLYEKTDAGFTLTGQGKDLDKDIVQKYEFKITK
jgi:hypothetical protein